jgi:hypothetical protein
MNMASDWAEERAAEILTAVLVWSANQRKAESHIAQALRDARAEGMEAAEVVKAAKRLAEVGYITRGLAGDSPEGAALRAALSGEGDVAK